VNSKCEYYDICHHGENPNTLMGFKNRDIRKLSTNTLFEGE
jgi:hypothetical protein